MVRSTRPLVMVAAFTGSLLVGLLLVLWAMGGLRNVAAPAAIVVPAAAFLEPPPFIM